MSTVKPDPESAFNATFDYLAHTAKVLDLIDDTLSLPPKETPLPSQQQWYRCVEALEQLAQEGFEGVDLEDDDELRAVLAVATQLLTRYRDVRMPKEAQ